MLKSIPLVILSAFLLLVSSAQAITRRADKECLLCHVLWFDAFKTDQKTLMEQRGSAIVIAGSVGLASSEEMCVTCHDGYVVDSRIAVVKENPHHTLKKVPDGYDLPEIFRLDSNNEIYCGTCHTLHDFKGSAEVGSSPFLRTKNDKSQMCMACHDKKTSQKGFVNHPVLKQSTDAQHSEAVKKGLKFSPAREIICQSCHSAHSQRSMVSPINDSSLCLICHKDNKNLINSKHDLRLTLPEVKNIKQLLPSESGPCGACHTPHNAAGKKLWAKRIGPGNPASQMCLTCHAEKNQNNTKGVGQHSHPTDAEPVARANLPKELPLFSAGAARDSSGKVQCMTCHEVHQWDPNSPANTGGKGIEGDAATSFLRMSNSRSSALCLACHVDKRQLVASDHNLEATAPEEKNLFGFAPRESGPCGACHIPHNAAGNKLWAKELSADQDVVIQLCTGCHKKDGSAGAKLVGSNSHPLNVGIEKLKLSFSGGQAVKSLPLYDGDGTIKAGQKVVCLTCHEPHTWDPENTRAGSGDGFKNIEGDHTNSFLRKVNSPSSALCGSCHVDKALVAGTAHDLSVTAPQAKNLRDQTVKESGQCGACHFVHNSPNKVKLWAWPLGRVKKHQGVMDALCTGCHSKRDIAKKKIPRIAWHPREKLIINTTQFDKGGNDYTPLFDDNGREVEMGNLSCPSCHNAHQWSYLAGEKSAAENPPARGAYKFLRTASKNTVCVACHGPEALFRYLYFHEPEMRATFKEN